MLVWLKRFVEKVRNQIILEWSYFLFHFFQLLFLFSTFFLFIFPSLFVLWIVFLLFWIWNRLLIENVMHKSNYYLFITCLLLVYFLFIICLSLVYYFVYYFLEISIKRHEVIIVLFEENISILYSCISIFSKLCVLLLITHKSKFARIAVVILYFCLCCFVFYLLFTIKYFLCNLLWNILFIIYCKKKLLCTVKYFIYYLL